MATLVPFVALEFSSALGPSEGRYLVRGPASADGSVPEMPEVRALEEDEDDEQGYAAMEATIAPGDADVLQLALVGAPPPRGGLVFRRARKRAPGEAPREVSLLIATLIGATNSFASERDAVAFLDGCRGDEEQQSELVEGAIDVVNLAVRAYRGAARDPFLAEITRQDAREVRIGYGHAQEIVQGGWREAFSPPPSRAPRISREERLRPAEAVALALGGRLPLLDAEDLALRTMLDLERGRTRAAAVQLRATIDLLVAELSDADEAFAEPRDELLERSRAVERLAALALDDRLDDGALEELQEQLDRVEDALEDWRAWHDQPTD